MLKILFLISWISFSASAKTITFGSDEISLPIRSTALTDSKESAPTYFRFPRAVARIDNATMFSVKATSSTGVQPDYRELELKPRTNNGSQRIEVLLNDGTIVKIKLTITENAEAPGSYDFEPKRVHESPKPSQPQAQGQIADLSIMRSVLEGDTPVGFSKKNYSLAVSCAGYGPKAKLVAVTENSAFKVFEIEFVNDSFKKPYLIREENILIKNRDLSRSPLIHVKNNILNPVGAGQNKTIVTILTDPSVNINRMKICDLGDQVEIYESKAKSQKSK